MVRVVLKLLAINGGKPMRCDSREVYFQPHFKTISLLYMGSYYWDSFRWLPI